LEQAEQQIMAMQAVLREPIAVGDTAPKITASCGIVQVDVTTLDLDSCVAQADEGSRQAKALGGDRCVVLDEGQSAEVLRRRRMLRDLEQAINEGQVEPYFQPIVSLVTGQPRGFELLFRTSAPGLQEASVYDCIVMAEDSGLIHRLGLGVLRFALEVQVEHREVLAGLVLGVNVSVLQLVRRDFADAVAAALEETGADAAGIHLEVTESQWLDTGGPARDTLARLKQMGFRLALDDFGTGYASLAYLQALPLDSIKIDRRFIAAIGDGAGRDASLCRALLAMGQATGLMVVAEGVETRVQAGALAALGFDRAQGFLWSEAMPLADALDWLARQRALSAP
jgi:EAL domain-containing protein (putative c-di-GMP-specific phosphodiesterase class I)